MPRYHIHFAATRDHYPQSSEHTRVITLEHPIEYDSDIDLVQNLAAENVGAKSAMLTSWRELKGDTRPVLWHCQACRVELASDRRCDVCGQPSAAGALPEARS
jgi:hypothetical protein